MDIPQFLFSISITPPTLSHPEDLPITSACRAPHRHVDQSDAWPLGTVMPFHRPTSSACEILFDSDGRFSLVSSHRSHIIQRSTGHDSISPRFEPLDARMATAVGRDGTHHAGKLSCLLKCTRGLGPLGLCVIIPWLMLCLGKCSGYHLVCQSCTVGLVPSRYS